MATGRWFRMYDELLDDPKVQMLPMDMFKAWVNLLCLANRNDGVLPDITAVAFALRLDEKRARKLLADLVERQLLDVTGNGHEPHGWRDRQYQSDVSTVRVKRHRERQKERQGNASNDVSGNVSSSVTETPPDTEADTDTERVQAARVPSPAEFDLREKRMSDAARPMPLASCTDFTPMNIMISNGFSLELDILPAIEAAKRDGKRIRAWGSMVGWVETQHASRTRAAAAKPTNGAQSDGPAGETFIQKRERIWRQQLAAWKKMGSWSDHWGAEPGNPSCEIPAEFVAQFERQASGVAA